MTARVPVVCLLALLAAGACSGDDTTAASTTSTPTADAATRATSLYDLEVGDCLNGLGTGRDLQVRRRPCGRPHQAEVYGVVTVTGRRFPGADVLRREAATHCAQRFAAYTGEAAGPGTDLAFAEVVPTAESWAAGDREALCLALALAGGVPLVGSIAAGGEA